MRLAILLMALFLTACVPPPKARTTQLDSERAMISAKGQYIHDGGDMTKAMLREAAKQAKQRGYGFFEIVQSNDRSMTGTNMIAGPIIAVPTGGGTGMLIPTGGNAAPYRIPAGDMIVRFLHEPTSGSWNADEILAMKK